MKNNSSIYLCLLCFLFVVSCNKKPDAILNGIYEGANKNDVSQIIPYVVPDSVKPFTDEEKMVFADYLSQALGYDKPYNSFEIQVPEVTDTTTRIKFNVVLQLNDGKTIKEGGTLKKNENGKWKLGLFNPPGEYDILFTIEDPNTNNHELMRSLHFAYIMTMAKRGDPEYLGMAAVFYKDGILIPEDFDRFIELSENAASQGSAEALYQLGDIYYRGVKKKVNKDDAKAFQYMLKAAEAGNVLAMNNVGYFYETGVGTPRNPQKAGEWYEKSAYEGNLDAFNNLGSLLLNGNGVEKDYYGAFNIFKTAAEAGNTTSMLNLAQMYQKGQGTDVDYDQMLYWATKAAESNLVSAINFMGDIYYQGIGVEKDYDKSFYWYKRSADQKNLYGEYMVGQSYHYGRGVEKNLELAKSWYLNGDRQGYQPSKQALNLIYQM